MINLILIISGLFISFASYGQIFPVNLDQAPLLKANAGADITISYLQGCRLGGSPTAEFGYGNYTYLWEPAESISNQTLSNPMVYPSHTTTYMVTVTDGIHCIARDEITIHVESSGIEKFQIPLEVNIFPNPSDGFVNLYLEGFEGETEYRIYDALGKLLISKSIHVQWVHQEEIDLKWLEHGLYFVRIFSQSGQASKIFMIQ